MAIKVIFIEESASLSAQWGAFLSDHGMEVLACAHTDKAVELALRENPGLVLLDVTAVQEDGWRACKSLRQATCAPIIVLSALDDPAAVSSALDAGADDYLVKPVAGNILLAHIRTLSRRYEVEQHRTAMLHESAIIRVPGDMLQSFSKPVQL